MTTAALSARNEPPRVAYAVGRNVGNAVVRNRTRRRLRAATLEHADLLRPGCGYLVRVLAEPDQLAYRELSAALRHSLRVSSDGAHA